MKFILYIWFCIWFPVTTIFYLLYVFAALIEAGPKQASRALRGEGVEIPWRK
jgi:hypothetical protein